MDKAGVIGAGQMGSGIAQVIAEAGLEVSLYDAKPKAAEQAKNAISSRLNKNAEKGRITENEARGAVERISIASTLAEMADADLLIEAAVEDISVKTAIFTELDNLAKPSTVLASNTSSISITYLAAQTSRPERVIGIHFMNPVPLMKLVEVIRGMQTSEEVYRTALSLVERLGKTAVTAKKDFPGFIVNRILVPMINEAFFVLMEGLAEAEEIDIAMKLGTNQPMGPLALADLVGLDTCLAICRIFHSELGEDKYRPCPLLVKYVEAGWLGKKSGRGVYAY